MNNPLMYNDPSGEVIETIVGAIIIGAIIGAASYTLVVWISTGSLREWNVFDFGKSIFMGALSGAITFGIGEAFQSGGIFADVVKGKELLQAGLHGVSQGFTSALDGGNFLQRYVSGALGSLAASGWQSAFGAMARVF